MAIEDQVEAVEVLHHSGADEMHFRFIGAAKNRQFIVNIQFDAADGMNGERLRPEEFDFMVSKVLRLVLDRIAEAPNPALH